MGSFVGHIDESIFFLLLAFWWMFNKFTRYIRCGWEKTEYTSEVSYPLPTKRYIPLEAILKTLFPAAGLVGEIISGGPSLLDENGNFRKLEQIQHMSIYGIFIVHGIIDILMSYGIPLPKGLDFLSAIGCFLWYGFSFSFHAHMHGKEALETMIHVLPVYVMYATAVAGIVEVLNPHLFLASLARVYSVLLLGTWFFQASFIMYVPYPWPGSDLNPKWDQTDVRNVHFLVATFGYHMILNMVVVTVTYLLCYFYMRIVRGEGSRQFTLLVNDCTDELGYQTKRLLDKSPENI